MANVRLRLTCVSSSDMIGDISFLAMSNIIGYSKYILYTILPEMSRKICLRKMKAGKMMLACGVGLLDYFRFDGDAVFRKTIIKLVYKLIIVIVEFTFECIIIYNFL